MLFPPDTQYSLANVILFDGSHFRRISVDAKNTHGNHLIYDGMNGPANRIRIFKTNDPISNYADGNNILELWYVKVDRSSAEIVSASPSTTLKPVGIPNLGHTCYLTTLVQIIFWVLQLRKRLIAYELSNRDSTKIQPIISGALEVDSDSLLDALGSLKKLLVNMKTSMVEKKANLRNIMKKSVECLGLYPKENQCVNKFWNNFFHNYFEYLELSHLYRLQITTFYLEVLDHNKTGTAHEKKVTLPQNLLTTTQPDLRKYV